MIEFSDSLKNTDKKETTKQTTNQKCEQTNDHLL